MKMVPQEKSSLIGPNPYNSHKEWENENKTGEAFVSADDSMAYARKPKVAVIDKMENVKAEEEATTEDSTPQKEEASNPYQRVDYKKRYDDLKRHHDKRVNEFKDREKELMEQLSSNRPKYTPPKSADELDKFKEENPDIYGVVESVAHLQAAKQLEDLQKELKEIQEKLALEEAKRAYVELKALVPDFEAIRQDDNFHNWADQQPKEIQDWIYNNRTNVQLAAQAINLYKASKGLAQANVQQPPRVGNQPANRGADEAVTVKARKEDPNPSGKVWTRAEIGKLSWKQYEKYKDEIDRAYAEGRIVR